MGATSVALGTLVRIDFDGSTNYVTVGRIKGVQSPSQTGTEADGKELNDTYDVPIPGIEAPSDFTFTQYWHPGEVAGAKVETAFNARRDPAGSGGGVLGVQLAYPHDGIDSDDTMPTELFDARILTITKASLDEPNSVFTRDITCRRITPITTGTYTVP
mgnify:CR=1 FL=1